ncbi:hypothetical protein M2H29_13395 [Vibrio vulnificus]|nr:hypothetical protein [Vibrio vulnificus]
MMLIATFFDYDGQEHTTGAFTFLTRSLYKALMDAQIITGFKLILFATHFAVLGKGKARLVVGRAGV